MTAGSPRTSRVRTQLGLFFAAVLAGSSLVAGATPAPSGSPDAGPPSHWLLTVRVGPSGAEILGARKLPWALKPLRGSSRSPRRTWWVSIEDADGKELRGTTIAAPDELRGEFRQEFRSDGGIEAHHLRTSPATFSLRLPDLPNAATIHFWADVNALAAGDPRLASASSGRVDLGRTAFPR